MSEKKECNNLDKVNGGNNKYPSPSLQEQFKAGDWISFLIPFVPFGTDLGIRIKSIKDNDAEIEIFAHEYGAQDYKLDENYTKMYSPKSLDSNVKPVSKPSWFNE